MYSCLGTCNETLNRTFVCHCQIDWEGDHCERIVNYCKNVTCQNNGVCRSLLGDYLCECLGDSYSGRHCEITAKAILVYKPVSKSCGYVAIISMTSVAMLIVMMDILKYCFAIDPVREQRERIRQQKQARKRQPPVIQRFIYVNRPATPKLSNEQIALVNETGI
jgi:hypothetical protein